QTDLNASRGRVIGIDVTHPDRAQWKEILPEAAETLQAVNVVNDMVVAVYLKDAQTRVKIFSLDGKFIRDVDLPGIVTANGFGGRPKDTETFYSFSGFTTPTTVYRYDMVTGKSSVFKRPKVDFNPDDYETKQVFYNSKDGTRVPMFIVHRKGLKLD